MTTVWVYKPIFLDTHFRKKSIELYTEKMIAAIVKSKMNEWKKIRSSRHWVRIRDADDDHLSNIMHITCVRYGNDLLARKLLKQVAESDAIHRNFHCHFYFLWKHAFFNTKAANMGREKERNSWCRSGLSFKSRLSLLFHYFFSSILPITSL